MNELLLIARIGGRRIGLRATQVNSVIELDKLTPIPRAPSYILGLTPLRSSALTVVDCALALELGQPTRPAEQVAQAIVVEHEGHSYALLVDEVEDVAEAHSDVTEVSGEAGAGWKRAAQGMVETAIGPVLLLDAAAIIIGPLAEAA
ncbi:MAG: chemotaxis protein CheW [Sphingomonadales bacterium]|nr:chemotaxis protein CheW [Sphingomonadales bacterium]MBD3774365.1 chemotaxis protein CheW [Paracoccaceae bacterium]